MSGLPSIAFVIPTKDRPQEVRTMLRSLAAQDEVPAQVLVIDSSAQTKPELAAEFPDLPLTYVAYEGKPSAAAQRNDGARRVSADIDLVCFFDDDQVLLPGALRAMLAFWTTAPAEVAGAGFNLVNEVDRRPSFLKRSWLSEKLGLYSRTPGAVAPSGWQALPGVVKEDLPVEWLTTGAAVWRREILQAYRFDEFFDGYSYLEDLDFSYTVSRAHRLVIVAAAEVHHHPSKLGRIDKVRFGEIEVRNRLYFVRKHRLSCGRSLAAIGIRFLMSVVRGTFMPWTRDLARALGNCRGLWRWGVCRRTSAPR